MDSGISQRQLKEQAQAVGLTGMALTEHLSQWRTEDVERLRQESGLMVINAREWSTDMGHIIVIGLGREVKNILRARDLRQVVQAQGAYMILCHPFRYFPGPSNFLFGNASSPESLTVEDLSRHPLFELVDAIEVLNGGCTKGENELAQEVSRVLGKAATGGSDAHMPAEMGRYVTVFEKELESEEEFLAELRAGRFWPGQRSADGQYALLARELVP